MLCSTNLITEDTKESLCEWTQWLQIDDRTGRGDFESPIADFMKLDIPSSCEKPMNIEARVSGSNITADDTGEKFQHYNINNGFICKHEDQDDLECENYEIRLCCLK